MAYRDKQKEKETRKKYAEENKDKKKAYDKEYKKANREKINKQQREWRAKNKEKVKKYKKTESSKPDFSEKKSKYNKEYRKRNRDRLNQKSREYQQKNKDRLNTLKKESTKKRRDSDSLYNLKIVLRSRTYKAFKAVRWSKSEKTEKLLGTDYKTAFQHIENLFTEGMSWENHGEWHIDHKKPLASAKTEEELKKLCHYTNLQPLWALDNIRKGAKT